MRLGLFQTAYSDEVELGVSGIIWSESIAVWVCGTVDGNADGWTHCHIDIWCDDSVRSVRSVVRSVYCLVKWLLLRSRHHLTVTASTSLATITVTPLAAGTGTFIKLKLSQSTASSGLFTLFPYRMLSFIMLTFRTFHSLGEDSNIGSLINEYKYCIADVYWCWHFH